MARLIDANFLKKRLDDMEVRNGHKYYRAGMDDALHDFMPQLIDEQPTVDAVEVVRCKDCKHWADGVAGCTDHVKCCKIGYYMVGENGYCVYGERKTEDG